jgi:hypothetical protein
MAAPTYVSAGFKNVVITVVTGIGVTPNTPKVLTGYVEQVGLSVTKASVGTYVMFRNADFFSEGTVTWAIVHEDNILSLIITGL